MKNILWSCFGIRPPEGSTYTYRGRNAYYGFTGIVHWDSGGFSLKSETAWLVIPSWHKLNS